MSTPTIEITPATVQEAYKILGIDQEVIIKSEKEKEDDDEDDEEKVEMKKSEIDALNEKIKKQEKELVELKKGEDPPIEKSDTLNAINALNENVGKKFEAMATINKSLSDQLSQTQEELKKSQEQIKTLEDTPIRKSLTTKNFIEKAFQENDQGNKMLSVSQHRREIQGMLIEKAGLDGDEIEKSEIDNFWNNELQYFEATNSLHPKAVQKLLLDDKIQVVR